MLRTATPSDLDITPRNERFGRDDTPERYWLGGDPIATAFYNALSVTFPLGEAFFVDSVRANRDGAPEKLAKEIQAFIKQEVMHTREHVAFNRHVTAQGYDIAPLEEDLKETLALTKGRPPVANLASTMALEHFTAILAHELLSNPAHLQELDSEPARLWRWHALEEIEHKGVAYDTWLHATRHWSRFKRWRIKALVMLMVTWRFYNGRKRGMLELLRQDGITGWKAKFGLARYAFLRPGMVRKIAGAWISFFLPGFQPWNEDDRTLIAAAERRLALS
ncbi:MAG: metal-dependent hydrolase [Pseudomonadota bacterium]